MKKIFTLLAATLAFVGVQAAEKTIWEGTYDDGIEISSETVATFMAGDVLRVYLTVPEGGANFKICFKGAPDWTETAIPSIDNQWPWANGDETYHEFALTQEDLTTMDGKSIYLYNGDNSVITKVTLITEGDEPASINDCVSPSVADGKIYNLRGMEVKGEPSKGIYVRNGKKIVIR